MHRWFGSRRTYTKILVAVGVAIAGTVATGALSLAGIRELQHTRNVEVRQAMPYITALNGVALDAKTAANDEREYINTGDTASRDKALSRQYTIKAALTDALAAATDATGKAATEEIQQSIEAWFTAVQTEFKTYESETARATDEISQRVAAIQQDTGGAVTAIGEISAIITEINQHQTTIASAIEEQSATTQEMSRSVEQAASVGQRVAETAGEVASSVELTRNGISESNRAASSLAEMSGSLRSIVQGFRY